MANQKATKFLAFQGKCKWACLDHPDTKFSIEGKWSIRLYPTQESYDAILELKKEGIRNVLKKDEDGYYTTFSRPCQKMFKGRLKAFEPPVIEDKDGSPLPRSTRIGNGSDVTITIEVYYFTTPQKTEGAAARLASVRIDNLVPYTREDYNPKEQRAAKAVDKLPVQTW